MATPISTPFLLEVNEGTTVNTEPDFEAAQAAFESAGAVNLDEVVIDTVRVAFREYVPTKALTEDSVAASPRMRIEVRMAEINTYVPMFVLNRMIASEKKARKARAHFLADDDGDDTAYNEDPMLTWVSEQVYAVWKLTEPDMTRERFGWGLDLIQINGLFARFFGETLRRLRSKALPGSALAARQ